LKLSSREGLTLGRKVKVDEPSEIRWILRGTIPANSDSSWTFYSGEEAVFEKYIVPWLGDLGVTVPKFRSTPSDDLDYSASRGDGCLAYVPFIILE
jgi:hypothetical protein